ncbi:PorV/PorQ family protein [candidate division KSB1 bacterium]|nr:PorV/PorQ family protein [candidate division KSB1 bacterium]
MKFVRNIVILLSIIITHNNLFSQSISRVGTTAAPFLKIGVGARALAMGEAFVTQANDATALYWNPAGLGVIAHNQFIFTHYDYIADLDFDYAGIALQLPLIGTVGLQFSYLGAPDIERTTLESQDGNGEMVSAAFYTAGISYGRALTDRFSIGGTAKYIRENLWHSSASGMALDIGVLYTTIFKNINIGMSISNFGTSMQMSGRDLLIQHDIDPSTAGNNETINANLATDHFPLPILFRVGLSSNLTKDFLGVSMHDLIIAVDAVHPNDNKEYLNIGAEYIFNHMIALRTGYRQLFLEYAEGGPTFGFGLHFTTGGFSVNMDYAAIDYGRFDYVNKYSLILMF